MIDIQINYKVLHEIIEDETYRTDTATLLAYDNANKKYLFRALNSNYFIQDDKLETMSLVESDEAEKIWESMPGKNIVSVIAAFPQKYGGIGLDTYTNLYDD